MWHLIVFGTLLFLMVSMVIYAHRMWHHIMENSEKKVSLAVIWNRFLLYLAFASCIIVAVFCTVVLLIFLLSLI